MIDKIRNVADLRRQLVRLDGLYRQAKVDWELANTELFEKRSKINLDLLVAETVLKAEALDQYRLDHISKPLPGLEIKQFTVLNYDETDALAWGLRTGMAIKLDKSAFESIAKELKKTIPLNFVEISKVPQCQIATDLDKVLEGVKTC